ncbi:MAG TPA: hypothetical protein VN845_13565 [Solirubrobacteraceae bacterium]|nr:hypothetical protein [Solirubrobacteraceae bacterium]
MLNMHLVAAAFAVTALVASGCGGSSKTTTTGTTTAANVSSTETTTQATTTAPTVKIATGTPLTRATLIADAEAICAKANAKTSVLVVSSINALTRTYPQIAIYNRTEAGELAKLVPPTTMVPTLTTMIDDLNLHSQYLLVAVHDIEQKSKSIAQGLIAANKFILNLLTTARQAGFDHCGKLS